MQAALAKPNSCAPTGSNNQPPARYAALHGSRNIAFPFSLRAKSNSYALCKFIQKSADMPKYWASRNAMSAVIFRFPAKS